MDQIWLFFSLLGLISGFGLLTALILLRRMVPLVQPPVVLLVGALTLMGVSSLLGVYLRIQEIPRSILFYRLINAGAWGFAIFAPLRFLWESIRAGKEKKRKTALPSKILGWVHVPVGCIVGIAAFLSAHPPAGGVFAGTQEGLPELLMLLIEVLVGLLAVLSGVFILKKARPMISRPWKIVFRGLGIALLILVPANLLEFIATLIARAGGGGDMKDGFIFAFGYGVANLALIASILEAFRSGRRGKDSLSLPSGVVKLYGITRREQEIIEKLLAGKSDREIADELYISPRTVDTHLRNIFRKCGVGSRLQLTHLIYNYGDLRSS